MTHLPYLTLVKSLARTLLCIALTLSLLHVASFAHTTGWDEAEELYRQGLAHAESGDFKAAIEKFTRVIQLNSRYAEAYYQRGLLRSQISCSNLPGTANDDFVEATRLKPDFAEAYLERGRLITGLGFLDVGQIDFLNEAIRINPDYVEAYYQRGQTHLVTSNVKDAIADFTEVVRRKPDYAEAFLARASLYVQQKNYKDAIDDFTKLIQLKPEQTEAYQKRGMAHLELRNFQLAIDDFTKVIGLAPKKAEAYERRGLARLETGDENGAIDDFLEAIRVGGFGLQYNSYFAKLPRNPRIVQAYYEAAMAARYHRSLPDNRNAIPSFTRAFELNPNFPGLQYQRGLALFDAGNTAEALSDFTELIGRKPDDPYSYYDRGLTYLKLGRHREAVADLTRALELSPAFSHVYYQRGRAYAALGDNPRAIADFTEAIRVDSQFAEAYYRRGRVYDASNEKAKAIDDYTKTIENGQKGNDRERVDLSETDPAVAIPYYRGLARMSLGLDKDQSSRDFTFMTPEARLASENFFYDAIQDFSQLIESKPNSPEPHYQRGRARWFYSKGSIDSPDFSPLTPLENDLNQAIRLNPDFTQALLVRAAINSFKGGRTRAPQHFELAAKDLDAVVRLQPRWASAYLERAAAHGGISEVTHRASMLADYAKAIEIEPDNAEANLRRGRLRRQVDGDEALLGALADFTRVIQLQPEESGTYRERGEVHFSLRRYREAEEDFTRAIELEDAAPGSLNAEVAAAYRRRGCARFELGDGRAGAEDQRQSKRFSCPTCAAAAAIAAASKGDVFFLKGLKLFSRGDTRGARENLEQAARLYHTAGNMTKYQSARYQLGRL